MKTFGEFKCFWFCVGLVKGPLEIMGANYGDYDTLREGDQLYPRRLTVSPRQTLTVLISTLFPLSATDNFICFYQYDHDRSILAAKRTLCELGHLPLLEKATQKSPMVPL